MRISDWSSDVCSSDLETKERSGTIVGPFLTGAGPDDSQAGSDTMSLIPFDDRDGAIWFDGGLVPWREAKVHVLTHGLHYASRSEEHTSELQSLMRISYAVFCLKKKIYK